MSMKHSNVAIFIPHSGCVHQCSFCNQHTISGQQKDPDIDEVRVTLDQAVLEIADKSTTEIAFFGGSFTAIDKNYMIDLLTIASNYVTQHRFMGIRISTRPDEISEEILTILKKYNVTAIELGVQSLDDEVLKLNERGHTLSDVYVAVELIKKYKFSLGLQMMIGLYGDCKESVYFTAKTIVEMNPDTVRIYPTVILKGTKLAMLFQKKQYVPIDIDTAIEYCADFIKMFTKNGIDIIKVGLHASKDVEKDMVGGIYHPAFRELCESKIYYDLLEEQLHTLPRGEYDVHVNSKNISKLVGQKRKNFTYFFEKGYRLSVKSDMDLSDFEIILISN